MIGAEGYTEQGETSTSARMYYVTVTRNGSNLMLRAPYADYAEAIEACSRFYRPRVAGSRATLTFQCEVINGVFARSYASLRRPEDVDTGDRDYASLRHYSVKHSCAFEYDASYRFCIESDFGIADVEKMLAEDDVVE
jgi:hypothetical protein